MTVVEKESEKEEDKPFTELKELTERAPLDLAQRGSVVSLLAEQRRECSPQETTPGLDPPQEPTSRQTIMVTSAHNFPAFSGQPTYLVS